MTDKHVNHLKHIQKEFNDRSEHQYIGGQIEHGGNLWTKKNLIDEALSESIDLVVYLVTLKDQLDKEKERTERLEAYIEELEAQLAGSQG